MKGGYQHHIGFIVLTVKQAGEIKLTKLKHSRSVNRIVINDEFIDDFDSEDTTNSIPSNEPNHDLHQVQFSNHSNQTRQIANISNDDGQQQLYESNKPISLENQIDKSPILSEFDCEKVNEIPQAECETLVNLYIETDGNNWTHNNGWLKTYEHCSWYGIVVCKNKALSEIDLQYNQLKGKVPDFSALTHIKRLNLVGNQLIGNIPTFEKSTQLMSLGLSKNQLTGKIPEFKTLTQLWVLGLSDNQLEGHIPSFSEHKLLFGLGLANNKLTGSIPNLDILVNLNKLEIGGNDLCRNPDIDYSPWDEVPQTGINIYPLCQ